MTDKAAGSDPQNPEPGHRSGRKRYRSPTLHRFGRLSRLTQGSGGMGNDGGGLMTKMSDRALKENIIRIGTLPAGYGLYLFDYVRDNRAITGRGRQLGVMAGEVENSLPEAVSMHASGYKSVNYDMLGITAADAVFAFRHR